MGSEMCIRDSRAVGYLSSWVRAVVRWRCHNAVVGEVERRRAHPLPSTPAAVPANSGSAVPAGQHLTDMRTRCGGACMQAGRTGHAHMRRERISCREWAAGGWCVRTMGCSSDAAHKNNGADGTGQTAGRKGAGGAAGRQTRRTAPRADKRGGRPRGRNGTRMRLIETPVVCAPGRERARRLVRGQTPHRDGGATRGTTTASTAHTDDDSDVPLRDIPLLGDGLIP